MRSDKKPTIQWGNQPEKIKRLVQLIDKGKSYRQIGDEFGVSKNTIIGAVKRLLAKKLIPKAPEHVRDGRKKGVPQKRRDKPNRGLTVKRVVSPPAPSLPPLYIPEDVFGEQTVSCTLFELNDKRCRWPVGDRFCGMNTYGKPPYCPTHTHISGRK